MDKMHPELGRQHSCMVSTTCSSMKYTTLGAGVHWRLCRALLFFEGSSKLGNSSSQAFCWAFVDGAVGMNCFPEQGCLWGTYRGRECCCLQSIRFLPCKEGYHNEMSSISSHEMREPEPRSGKKQKPLVTLDLNLFFYADANCQMHQIYSYKSDQCKSAITCLSAANFLKRGRHWKLFLQQAISTRMVNSVITALDHAYTGHFLILGGEKSRNRLGSG